MMNSLYLLFSSAVGLNVFDKDHGVPHDYQKIIDKHKKAVGAVILITKNNQDLLRNAFGKSDNSTLLDTKMTMGIGSNTKTFTNVLIFKLIEEGKLNLEQPITKVLPQDVLEFLASADSTKSKLDKIKLKHLMNHTSGLRDETQGPEVFQLFLGSFYGTIPPKKYTPLEVFHLTKLNYDKNTEAGQKAEYCNHNTNILGVIIEHITKKTYPQYLREIIFDPVGMKNSYLSGYENPRGEIGYSWDNEGKSVKEIDRSSYDHFPFASGAIFANCDDVVRFRTALFDGKIISKSTLNMMIGSPFAGEISTKEGVTSHNFLCGMFVRDYKGQKIYYHMGGTLFYCSMIISVPALKIHAVAIVNSYTNDVVPLLDELIEQSIQDNK